MTLILTMNVISINQSNYLFVTTKHTQVQNNYDIIKETIVWCDG